MQFYPQHIPPAALPPAHNVASVVILAIGSTCATPEHPLDLHLEEQKIATLGAYTD